jgi:hypothetical protein
MAGPSSPFSGPSQVDGAASSTRRGRGFHGLSAPHLSKTPNAARGASPRGRGRGAPAPRPGRARGAVSNTWRRKPESNTGNEAPASPFAQLKQNNPPSSTPNGKPTPQKPPVSHASRGDGAPRTSPGHDKMIVEPTPDPRRQVSTRPSNGTTGVPVEDASVLNWYNSHFEQVGGHP